MIEFKRIDEKDGETLCYRVRDHLTLSEMMQEFRYFLLALGYHPSSVEDHIEAD